MRLTASSNDRSDESGCDAVSCSRRTLLVVPLVAAFARVAVDLRGSEAPVETVAVPMFRGNPARTGEHPGPGPIGEPTGLWQVRLGKVLSSSPAVVDGIIYIGSVSPGTVAGGALHAVDETGVERWRLSTALGDGIFSSPAVADGIAIAGSYDGIVVAAAADTGDERWRFQAETSFFGSPAVVDGTVYLGDTGGHLYALGAVDGEERWRFVVGEGFERAFSSPAVVDGIVYCVSGSRRVGEGALLHAVDAVAGEERWRYTPDNGTTLRATPVVAAGSVYVATRGNLLCAVDAASGEERERFDLGVATQTELAVVGGIAYLGTSDGELHALDVATGQRRWSRRLSSTGLRSAPTVAAGVVYIGDDDGTIYAIDAHSGAQQWRARVGTLRSSPAVIAGVVYVGSNDGALRAIGAPGQRTPSIDRVATSPARIRRA